MDHLRDLDKDGMIILRRILKKGSVRVRNAFDYSVNEVLGSGAEWFRRSLPTFQRNTCCLHLRLHQHYNNRENLKSHWFQMAHDRPSGVASWGCGNELFLGPTKSGQFVDQQSDPLAYD